MNWNERTLAALDRPGGFTADDVLLAYNCRTCAVGEKLNLITTIPEDAVRQYSVFSDNHTCIGGRFTYAVASNSPQEAREIYLEIQAIPVEVDA